VTRLGARQSGFDSQQGQSIFLFAIASRLTLGFTQVPIQWVQEDLCLGVKQAGHEANHSPPTRTEVRNAWSHTSTYSPIYHHSKVLC